MNNPTRALQSVLLAIVLLFAFFTTSIVYVFWATADADVIFENPPQMR